MFQLNALENICIRHVLFSIITFCRCSNAIIWWSVFNRQRRIQLDHVICELIVFECVASYDGCMTAACAAMGQLSVAVSVFACFGLCMARLTSATK